MDKQHEEIHRKQFEEWAEEVGGQPWGYISKQRTQTGGYSVQIYQYMWTAWQASRASIVVDTPQLCGDGENDSEYTEGYNDGVTATEKTIRSIGLSIKGEGV